MITPWTDHRPRRLLPEGYAAPETGPPRGAPGAAARKRAGGHPDRARTAAPETAAGPRPDWAGACDLRVLVPQTGIEPATPALGEPCSIP